MKAVRFLQKQMSYNAGEIAGFADSVAEAYVRAGIAEWHMQPKDAPGKSLDDVTGDGAQLFAEQITEETTVNTESGKEPATNQASATEEATKPTSRRGR